MAAGGSAIDLKGLSLRLPNGTPLVNAERFSLRKGERTLMTGPSGSGKSTLFRAIAGIWPFGAGSITIPAGATLMMLPQRPYFPTGSLHGAVEYPVQREGTFTDLQISSALEQVGLPKLASQLGEHGHWNRMLSLGEQQRLGLARALLHTPHYLFLDEATASLDEPSEAALYRLLEEKLPAHHHRLDRPPLDARRIPPAQCQPGPRRRSIRAAGRQAESVQSDVALLQPAPRPWLAAHPAVPEIGERGQQHRAGQHRRQQKVDGRLPDTTSSGLMPAGG